MRQHTPPPSFYLFELAPYISLNASRVTLMDTVMEKEYCWSVWKMRRMEISWGSWGSRGMYGCPSLRHPAGWHVFPIITTPHTHSPNPLTYNAHHLYKQKKEVNEFGKDWDITMLSRYVVNMSVFFKRIGKISLDTSSQQSNGPLIHV